jgi:hypothetical protein
VSAIDMNLLMNREQWAAVEGELPRRYLLAACFILISFLNYSTALNMEAIYSSETSQTSTEYDVTYPEDNTLHSNGSFGYVNF